MTDLTEERKEPLQDEETVTEDTVTEETAEEEAKETVSEVNCVVTSCSSR